MNLFLAAKARMMRVRIGLPLRISAEGVDYGPEEGLTGVGADLDGNTLSVVGTARMVEKVARAAQKAGLSVNVKADRFVQILCP